ncbi:MAG: molecular chaperone DjlA [Gallionellales bacterium RIFCSPLOWO2_02_FULL_57_47]|nr:MAG: molecular chaperone DjlA [Gallionellales bacterium RIFCSPLOWO2_02_FULL_57_47]
MFKIIGVIAGYYFFGIFGALLGLFIGSFIDRIRVYGSGGMNPLQNALRQAVFLETVFVSMGKLAKADGRVSREEIDHVEQFMQKLGMTETHREQAIKLFKQGADPAFDIYPACRRFISVCGHTKNLREVLLAYLIVMALADGHFHPAEEALLTEIAGHLGYGPDAFKQMIEMVLNQSHFGGGKVTTAAALDDAYKALGVNKDSTDAEVKRAYRKLMSQYHPDKLMGQGVPEDMIAMATEQAKEIQLAYDMVKKSRNI